MSNTASAKKEAVFCMVSKRRCKKFKDVLTKGLLSHILKYIKIN